MLQIARADDEAQKWARRHPFLVGYLSGERATLADGDGEWTIQEYLAYVGRVCGWPNGTETVR